MSAQRDTPAPERVARFWCEVLGYGVPPPPEGFATWDEVDRALPPDQSQAAIAALHADARTAEKTDWVQIVEWYDQLVRLTGSPIVRLKRAVAVGEADGSRAGLAVLATLDDSLPWYTAVAACTAVLCTSSCPPDRS